MKRSVQCNRETRWSPPGAAACRVRPCSKHRCPVQQQEPLPPPACAAAGASLSSASSRQPRPVRRTARAGARFALSLSPSRAHQAPGPQLCASHSASHTSAHAAFGVTRVVTVTDSCTVSKLRLHEAEELSTTTKPARVKSRCGPSPTPELSGSASLLRALLSQALVPGSLEHCSRHQRAERQEERPTPTQAGALVLSAPARKARTGQQPGRWALRRLLVQPWLPHQVRFRGGWNYSAHKAEILATSYLRGDATHTHEAHFKTVSAGGPNSSLHNPNLCPRKFNSKTLRCTLPRRESFTRRGRVWVHFEDTHRGATEAGPALHRNLWERGE